jgi:GNAT superfamily N-acetyltransferase
MGGRSMLSPCGCDCSKCKEYGNSCSGCREIKGEVYWAGYVGTTVCPMFHCCVNEKKFTHCGQCSKLPCSLYYDMQDPSVTKEEHEEDILVRTQRLKNPIKFVYVNDTNEDFVMLCNQLDEYLFEAVGGEKQRRQYSQYNTLEDIHDVVLVYDNDRPVACASFKFHDMRVAEVKRVFVREEYRGTGLAKQLMEELENQAKKRGYTKLILETGIQLPEAMAFYKKIGYSVIENYGQYQNMKESVCMQKEFKET